MKKQFFILLLIGSLVLGISGCGGQSTEISALEKDAADTLETLSAGSFSFSANGGHMTFYERNGTEYEASCYTYWLEEGQALNDVMGTTNGAALIAIEKEGAEFTGWTLYEADSAFWKDEKIEEEGIDGFLYEEENENPRYLLLKNAVVCREAASTEELCGISVEKKNYYAQANWSE